MGVEASSCLEHESDLCSEAGAMMLNEVLPKRFFSSHHIDCPEAVVYHVSIIFVVVTFILYAFQF